MNMNMRVQLFLAGIVTAQLASWLGYLAAWGNIPGLGAPELNLIASAIASVVSSLLAAILMLVLARVNRFINYVAHLAEEEGSSVKGVVMRTDAEAMQIESPKAVGPSDVRTL